MESTASAEGETETDESATVPATTGETTEPDTTTKE
jgi:hypothetical protein